MSTFKAEVVKVKVEVHPNADRLDLIKIKGWQCVAQKGQYKEGDLAVYLPIDSILPEQLVKDLGIEKNYHRRLRTIKLRGCISQGMIMPLPPALLESGRLSPEWREGDDLTNFFGITKYEEPIPVCMSGIQLPSEPNFFIYTDIENIKNFPTALKEGELVAISEKIHGTNFRAAKIDGKLFVGSHRMNLARVETNLYWRGALSLKLDETLVDGEQVFGEVFGHGVQDLTYGKKQGEIAVRVFDVMKDKVYLDHYDFLKFVTERGWSETPIIFTGTWDLSLLKMTEGRSQVDPGQIKEGIVIKPLVERFSTELQGRCIAKAIGEEYLLRKEGTERH